MKTQKIKGYMHRILAAVDKYPKIFLKGKLCPIDVKHEKGCVAKTGKPCDCYPSIHAETLVGDFSIDHDGVCHPVFDIERMKAKAAAQTSPSTPKGLNGPN